MIMANSGSILGFVNQLQNMELQMASILMETAMKLASMTDANVFMLVEHSGGRYFSGKRHLCDSYLSHCLSPIGNDVEMEINPDISALQERPHSFFSQASPPSSAANARRSQHSTPPHHSETSTSSTSRKRSSTNHHPSQHAVIPVTSSSSSSPSKRRRASDVVVSAVASPNDLKQEVTSEGFRIHEGVGAETDGSFETTLTMVDHSFDAGNASDADIICEEEEGVVYPGGGVSDLHHPPPPPPPRLPLEDGDAALTVISDSDKQWIFAEILQHPKLEAVKQICDESVSDKNSVSSKLLNSLLYDFSKIAAAKCPFRNIEDPKCKQFYSLCFEEIWNQLPNLQTLHERGITMHMGKKRRSMKSFCRERTRAWFARLRLKH